MPTTTIKNIGEITNYKTGTLMFPSDYHDSSSYYDLKVIKKKYGFHSRSRVYILTKTFEDDVEYINAPINKDNRQRVETFCHPECQEARPSDFMGTSFGSFGGMWVSHYPYGDVIIFGETIEEHDNRMDKQREEKRMKKVRSEFMKKIKNCDEKMLCMLIDRLEELEGIEV